MGKKNNTGVTLVELLISIAILSIVGIAVFGFIVTSSKVYGKEVTETDLQYEAQLVINQLQDMLIDATDSVVYKVTFDDGTVLEVTDEEGIDEDKIHEKNMYIYNEKEYYQITWDKSEERIYYTKYIKGTDWEVDSNANHVRMADYVSNFRADISRLKEDSSVGFDFLFSINDVDYFTAHNITLRNRSASGADSDGSIIVKEAAQDKITITPAAFVLWPGDGVHFTHSITSDNGGYPSQDADWDLIADSAPAEKTVLKGDGTLEVDAEETNSRLTVRVTARYGKENEDGSINKPSKSAEVGVKQVTGVGVALTEGGSYTGLGIQRLIAGSTMKFTVNSIAGNIFVVPADLGAGTIKWYMEKGGEYASVDEKGMVSISDSAPVDTVIQVKAGFNRIGREWAYGYSNEYTVVRLKERGVIYVDDDYKDYIAPDEEVWWPEQQKVNIDWSKIPAELKTFDGAALRPPYSTIWLISVDGSKEEDNDTKGMQVLPYNVNTQNEYMILDTIRSMGWNNNVKIVKITLVIYNTQIGWWTQGEVFRSNTLTWNIPKAHYLYSYTKEGPYIDELSAFITNETPEAHIYYRIYGYASNEIRDWEYFDNPSGGWYQVTNQDYYTKYSEEKHKEKILKTVPEDKMIYFQPKNTVFSGYSVINHRIWSDYENTKITVNFNKANIYASGTDKTGYYVPLPGTEAYRNSGYLYGDCSFVITAKKTVKGSIYYKLEVTDKSGKEEKKAIGYYKSGNDKWSSEEPYKD
ncbi:pilin/secretion family protein with methylation motif [Kineothrix alysoides]|uniref:Pilin/secretion family protein with methylation motif n=1 Tax=Kineothrix alysoides TaxID=1469948 RepID=A0A4R1QWN3_9FIRM|nr:prepilin-type N-terminal cleavage/methylation domain-containing protein [Kineothrix alysoides]TCL55604.1 pilin/secretion family protein with methylation motif [Kineothrix alysoides]